MSQEQFVAAIEPTLLSCPFVEKTSGLFIDIPVVTFRMRSTYFIIDVLEGECCLTTATQNNTYFYDEEDYLEMVQELLEEVKEFIQGG